MSMSLESIVLVVAFISLVGMLTIRHAPSLESDSEMKKQLHTDNAGYLIALLAGLVMFLCARHPRLVRMA
jgi:hypothetical protein